MFSPQSAFTDSIVRAIHRPSFFTRIMHATFTG
jgi:hypothetical protein